MNKKCTLFERERQIVLNTVREYCSPCSISKRKEFWKETNNAFKYSLSVLLELLSLESFLVFAFISNVINQIFGGITRDFISMIIKSNSWCFFIIMWTNLFINYHEYLEAFEPMWGNSNYICYGVNSLRLGGLHLTSLVIYLKFILLP